jgi:hypothetical protein
MNAQGDESNQNSHDGALEMAERLQKEMSAKVSDINRLDLWAACKFDLNADLEALEAERLAQI